MKQTVQNEQTRLFAGFCNTVAAAVLTTGVVAPIVTMFYAFEDRRFDADLFATGSLICVLISGMLHVAARSILTEITE